MSVIQLPTAPLELAKLNTAQRQQLRDKASGIRLVYFDIDGTLLNSKAELPDSAIAQIQRIQRLGIKTAVASGRPIFAAQPLIDQLSLNSAGLFYTGAVLYHPAKKNTLRSQALASDDVRGIIAIARREQLHCELYTIDNYYIEHATAYTDFHSHYLKREPIVQDFTDALIAQGIYKIQLVVHENEEIAKLNAVQAAFPELVYATGHGADRPEIIFSSVVSAAADKLQAFEYLLDYHGLVAEQVMSLGDAGSDQVFLQQAGLGIAMGNATDAVKQYANYITEHVDNDGLAAALGLL